MSSCVSGLNKTHTKLGLPKCVFVVVITTSLFPGGSNICYHVVEKLHNPGHVCFYLVGPLILHPGPAGVH